ncbi:hypothetical protein SUGI_0913910 [Cryptomeria japonica]|nr:hypothetical protein SUGI_0913910 [Cryptomeria japonica]
MQPTQSNGLDSPRQRFQRSLLECPLALQTFAKARFFEQQFHWRAATLYLPIDSSSAIISSSISHNNLSGRIPGNIGQLTSLSELDCGHNQLQGTIPTAIGNLTYLSSLQLQDNQLTGKIPTQVGELRYLSNLMLYTNKLNGWLPQSLGRYCNFIVSDVSESGLEGPLPKNLCMRGLSDEIPEGLWGAAKLKGLFLNNNKFEGKISAAIGQAKNLSQLKISNNQFEGRIPREVGQLTKLQVFEASNNRLTDPIPHEFTNLSLVRRNSRGNYVAGESQSAQFGLQSTYWQNPGAFSNISSLDLSNNLLSGSVPLELGRLNLNIFNVSNNHLSGRIPGVLDIPAYTESFLGNPMLCGGRNLMLPSCSSTHKLSPQTLATILVPSLVILAIALYSIYLYRSCVRKQSDTPLWKMKPFHSIDVDESYIICNLEESNVIGSGGAGKVYKIVMPDGQAVAVKKIQIISRAGRNSKRKVGQEKNKMGEVEVD